LYNLVWMSRVSTAFEIGTGFGYSSFWIAAGMARNEGGKKWFGSLDNHSEGGLGESGIRFAIPSAKTLGLDAIINYFSGTLRDDLNFILNGKVLEMCFVDGNYRGDQPLTDYHGLRPFLREGSCIIWHDVNDRYTVSETVAEAERDGWRTIALPSSCNLAVKL
jgi:predicted O-methyltransferase YrrM